MPADAENDTGSQVVAAVGWVTYGREFHVSEVYVARQRWCRPTAVEGPRSPGEVSRGHILGTLGHKSAQSRRITSNVK